MYVYTGRKTEFLEVKNTPSDGQSFVRRKKSKKGGSDGGANEVVNIGKV